VFLGEDSDITGDKTGMQPTQDRQDAPIQARASVRHQEILIYDPYPIHGTHDRYAKRR